MKFLDEVKARGFEVDIEADPEGREEGISSGTMYMVYTPIGKQWKSPEGAEHSCMEWSAAGVRRIIRAKLIDCEPGCDCCWDD